MCWTVKSILEADYGCEERGPDDRERSLVILINESGGDRMLEIEDDLLAARGIREGSPWPEDWNETK